MATNMVVSDTPMMKLAPDARFIQITTRSHGLGLSIDAASGTFGVRLQMANPGNRIPAGLRCSIRLVR